MSLSTFRFLISLFLCISFSCYASEKAQVCAKYENHGEWSKGYKVEATVIRGGDLNRAARTLNYNSLSLYVVIFWRKEQAAVIEMGFPALTMIGDDGVDQNGVKWNISKSQICL